MCNDGGIQHSGGAPYSGAILLEPGLNCSLTMLDSYGDGWNGAVWEGFGQTLQLNLGSKQTVTFIVHPPPLLPQSPPPAPPAAPPPPSPSPPDLSFATLGYTDLGIGPDFEPECVTQWRRGAVSHNGLVVFAPTKYARAIKKHESEPASLFHPGQCRGILLTAPRLDPSRGRNCIGIFDPVRGIFTGVNVRTYQGQIGVAANQYNGAATAHNGLVIFAPRNAE